MSSDPLTGAIRDTLDAHEYTLTQVLNRPQRCCTCGWYPPIGPPVDLRDVQAAHLAAEIRKVVPPSVTERAAEAIQRADEFIAGFRVPAGEETTDE